MFNISKRFFTSLFVTAMLLCSTAGIAFAEEKDSSVTDISDDSKITKIEFEGNHLIKDSDIVKVMNMQLGDVYSKDLVQQNLKAIYKTGFFSEKMKAIPIPTSPDSLTLRIYLEENIPITSFVISGNTVVSTGEILDILNELEGQPQNLQTLSEAVTHVQDLYASKGYVLANVSDVQDDPDGCVNIEITEGRINSIAFEGNRKTKDFE